MKILKFITFALLFLQSIAGVASETVVWQGSKQFTNWSDLLNIDGSKLSMAKADDVLCLSITASQGAQLQMSWGNSWTNFEGLENLGISGNYEMQLTSQDLPRIKQGIHIKGVNFTLTAVVLKTNDGVYETQAEELFAWDDMIMSGATHGQTCTIGLKAYGGAGWFWQETADLSSYGNVAVEFFQPTAEEMTLQLLYANVGVKRLTVEKGSTECKLPLSIVHRKVYSLNIISEKAQTIAIKSVNLTDKQGNIIPTDIKDLETNSPRVISVEYYNLSGVPLACEQPGINIVKTNLEVGRTIVRKVLR